MAQDSNLESEGPAVRLAFTLVFQSYGLVSADRASDFWRSIRRQAENPPLAAVDGERLLDANFIDNFRKRLDHVLAARLGKEEKADSLDLRLLGFRYGSLELLIGSSNLQTLAGLLASWGPGLLTELIQTCGAEAFVEATGASAGEPEVVLSAEMRAWLHARRGMEAIDAAPRTTDAKPAAWSGVLTQALRVPWLVPMLLALAVCWVAYSGWIGQLDKVQQREAAFLQAQGAALGAYKDRIAQLEALSLDLLKKQGDPPRQPVANPAVCTCVPACCQRRCVPMVPSPPRVRRPACSG